MDKVGDNPAPRPARTGKDRPAPILVCETDFPLRALVAAPGNCLCLISRLDGGFFRPLGAAMVAGPSGVVAGTLSSGCIDTDIALHATESLAARTPRRLIYGAGSPFRDLQLPCGGSLEVTFLPDPDPAVLAEATARLARREAVDLTVTPDNTLSLDPAAPGLRLTVHPRPRLIVLGRGNEPRLLAALARAAGLEVEEAGPGLADADGTTRHELTGPRWPDALRIDPRTALAFFFHDHSWEPTLLEAALRSPAFYIGAMGSLAARTRREAALRALGLTEGEIARLANPFGLVTQTRSPPALAAGVLAQIFESARLDG